MLTSVMPMCEAHVDTMTCQNQVTVYITVHKSISAITIINSYNN